MVYTQGWIVPYYTFSKVSQPTVILLIVSKRVPDLLPLINVSKTGAASVKIAAMASVFFCLRTGCSCDVGRAGLWCRWVGPSIQLDLFPCIVLSTVPPESWAKDQEPLSHDTEHVMRGNTDAAQGRWGNCLCSVCVDNIYMVVLRRYIWRTVCIYGEQSVYVGK